MFNGPIDADRTAPFHILVTVRNAQDLTALLRTAYRIAKQRDGEIRVLTVNRQGTKPPWFQIPSDYDDLPIEAFTLAGRNIASTILEEVRRFRADLLIMGWRGPLTRGRYLLGRTLDPVIQGATCDVVVQRGEINPNLRRILIPAAGGPNAPRALHVARELAPSAEVTALYVADRSLGPTQVMIGQARLDTMVHNLPVTDRGAVKTKVVQARAPLEGILDESENGYDLLLLGAGNENVIGRFLFGDIPQAALSEATIPVMVVRRRLTNLSSFWRRLWQRIFGLVPPLTVEEQADVQRTMRRGSQPSPDFFVTLTLAAALAALGLLMDNSGIVIGAMIVAPLMTAILGMGLAIVLGDLRFFWRATATTIRGSLLAVTMGLIVGLIVPDRELTGEILAFSQPALLDLAVALTAGTAAAYAISRKEVSAALAGVAVAASLTPPLVNTGLALAFGEWHIAWRAALLFLANIVSIVATSGLVFIWMGFRPQPGRPDRRSMLRRGFWMFSILLVLVTIPLVTLTRQSLRESGLRRAVEAALQTEVAVLRDGEVVNWHYEIDSDATLQLDVTLRAAGTLTHFEARMLQERIAARLNRPVALSLSIVPTTQLEAYIPATFTVTPTPTSTGMPSPTPTPTSTPRPTATLTPSPTPTQTPLPTITPLPTSTATPTPWLVVVEEVGVAGLRVRYSPEGPVMGRFDEGDTVEIVEGPVVIEGEAWYRVSSPTRRLEGWVVGRYLAP